MSKIFLADEDFIFTYADLLAFVNSASASKSIKKSHFANCIFNLVLALANDVNLEMSALSEQKFLSKKHFENLEELICAVKNSKSKLSLLSSGSTGRPKEIFHSIKTLARNVKISKKYESAVWGFAYNVSHMAGLQLFLQAFFNGNTLVNLFEKPRLAIYAQIEKFAVTHISATPTFYRLLLPKEKTFPKISNISFGGEKSDAELYKQVGQIFPNAKIKNIYASTEAGSIFASSSDSFKISANLSGKIKIIDGELCLHKSLLGESETFNLQDDFYFTGDLVEFVNESEFRFVSRKNLEVNLGGYKVNPEEIELVLKSMDGISDALVFGKKNSVLGNILCAKIVRSNSELSEKEIRKILAQKLENFKIPRIIEFEEKLEQTKSGKIKRL